MPVPAPADRRFRRAQLRPVRAHRTGFVRPLLGALKRVITLAGIGFAIYLTGRTVLYGSAFQIRTIVVGGNARMSMGEVNAVLAGMRDRNILTTDLDWWRQRLLASPWVADAELRRVLPSTVEVAIVERRPVGVGRLTNALYLIDVQGVVIDDFGPQYADLDLPIIDGLVPAPTGEAAAVDGRRAALAARLLDALGRRPDLARRISQIDVSDEHDAVVILDGDSALVHVGEDQFLERVRAYVELAPTLRQRVAEIDYVDMRFGERVYVRPLGEGPGPDGAVATSGTKDRRRF
ncbi:MAG: FtsQ-type POTRA domain-containing protein [Acidobacteria bacterium]|nr:FtsQ-type POTRA domain-containing protein [Acidobacteriota bacterium]